MGSAPSAFLVSAASDMVFVVVVLLLLVSTVLEVCCVIRCSNLKRGEVSGGRWRLGLEGGRYLSVSFRTLCVCVHCGNGRRSKFQRLSTDILAGNVSVIEIRGARSSENRRALGSDREDS